LSSILFILTYLFGVTKTSMAELGNQAQFFNKVLLENFDQLPMDMLFARLCGAWPDERLSQNETADFFQEGRMILNKA
jgi:hypothetical protein